MALFYFEEFTVYNLYLLKIEFSKFIFYSKKLQSRFRRALDVIVVGWKWQNFKNWLNISVLRVFIYRQFLCRCPY